MDVDCVGWGVRGVKLVGVGGGGCCCLCSVCLQLACVLFTLQICMRPPNKHSSRVRQLLTTVALCVVPLLPHPTCACVVLLLLLQAAGQQGDTAPPPPEQQVDLHFIAFVEHDGGGGGATACCLLWCMPGGCSACCCPICELACNLRPVCRPATHLAVDLGGHK